MANKIISKVKTTRYIVTSSMYIDVDVFRSFGECFESDKDLSKVINISKYNSTLHAKIATNPPPAPGRPSKEELEVEEEEVDVIVEKVYEDLKEKVIPPKSTATKTKTSTSTKKNVKKK